LTLLSDSLTIVDNETWSEITSNQTTQNGQTTTDVTDNNGTWVRNGNTPSLTSAQYQQRDLQRDVQHQPARLRRRLGFAYVFAK
jgi:hypothetical protein